MWLAASMALKARVRSLPILTLHENIDICVRCGVPNSGHCFVDGSGELRALRQIPTGYIRPATRLLIPSGGLVDLDVLKRELDHLELGPDRVGIDFRTMIVEERDRKAEAELGLRQRLSSTLCGVGSAVARRVLRGDDVLLAEGAAVHSSWLRPYLTDVSVEINSGVDRNKNVLIEGTRASAFLCTHSESSPKTTSRDTSAAGCLSECGISPLLATNIVLVLRTFPIRVAGQQAGPMSTRSIGKRFSVRADTRMSLPSLQLSPANFDELVVLILNWLAERQVLIDQRRSL